MGKRGALFFFAPGCCGSKMFFMVFPSLTGRVRGKILGGMKSKNGKRFDLWGGGNGAKSKVG